MDDDDEATDDYTENVTVDKSLTIGRYDDSGADPQIAAGDTNRHVFHVTADRVAIHGLMVLGATGREKAGIHLGAGADHCTISNNTVFSNYFGIYLDSSSYNTLQYNTCHSNSNEGIFLWLGSSNNTIDSNISHSNGGHGGFFSWKFCKNNIITNNTCYSNLDHGIKIHHYSDNTLIENNTCSNNENTGIFIGFSDSNTVRGNECNYNEPAGIGIFLRMSDHNLVVNNICKFNASGISLDFCNYDNRIENNVCSDNEGVGIYIRLSSNNNIFTKNMCIANSQAMYIDHSSYNVISYNIFSLNSTGVGIEGGRSVSQNDVIYEWEDFREMQGPWERLKEEIEAKGVTIEGENSEGNEISWNNIEGNANGGLQRRTPVELDAADNWWGASSGPGGSGPGIGDAVSDSVIYSPWLDAPCPEAESETFVVERVPIDASGEEIQGLFGEDRVVGVDDFVLFVGMFGKTSKDAEFEAEYDLDKDEEVGLDDFLIFVANFGKTAVNIRIKPR